ncbi:MAG: PH domain-containing protein [Anaerolineales bacterium]|nr:PH domain-containing protein [Anaerolineales bacterium]MDW8447633.1 PH domain-containing protein [Anaerolineales bacterium]
MGDSYLQRLLGENEKIIFTTRQHWFILARNILLEALLILGIFIASVLLIVLLGIAAALVIPIGFLIMLLPVISLALDVAKWSSSQYVITNRRVIQIAGIFNKSTEDSSLEKVNDVRMVQSFLGRLFNYGDIEIMTASELGVNKFRRIAKPIEFKTAMLNAKEKLERGWEPRADEIQKEDIPALIANLNLLRKQGIITEEEFSQKKRELLSRL